MLLFGVDRRQANILNCFTNYNLCSCSAYCLPEICRRHPLQSLSAPSSGWDWLTAASHALIQLTD